MKVLKEGNIEVDNDGNFEKDISFNRVKIIKRVLYLNLKSKKQSYFIELLFCLKDSCRFCDSYLLSKIIFQSFVNCIYKI